MHEFGGAGRTTKANAARKRQYQHVLDVAKWPEQEQVWDLAKWDEANLREPPFPAFRVDAEEAKEDQVDSSVSVIEDAALPDETSLRLFPAEGSESGYSKMAGIIGGIVVGLLIVGGGLYAYKTLSTETPVPVLAMTPPVRGNAAAAEPVNPPVLAAPPAVPGPATAAPLRNLRGAVSPAPAQGTYSSRAGLPPPRVLADDDPINAPMTLTPETAPPPQQYKPVGQAAAQPPNAAPVVSVPIR